MIHRVPDIITPSIFPLLNRDRKKLGNQLIRSFVVQVKPKTHLPQIILAELTVFM